MTRQLVSFRQPRQTKKEYYQNVLALTLRLVADLGICPSTQEVWDFLLTHYPTAGKKSAQRAIEQAVLHRLVDDHRAITPHGREWLRGYEAGAPTEYLSRAPQKNSAAWRKKREEDNALTAKVRLNDRIYAMLSYIRNNDTTLPFPESAKRMFPQFTFRLCTSTVYYIEEQGLMAPNRIVSKAGLQWLADHEMLHG